MSFDSFYKITIEDMKNYILANDNNAETKSAFKKALYPVTQKTVLKPLLDEFGNPKMKFSKKKQEWYAVQKRVVVEGAPKEAKFNLVNAKYWFIDKYKDDAEIAKLTPKPKIKTKETGKKATDDIKDW